MQTPFKLSENSTLEKLIAMTTAAGNAILEVYADNFDVDNKLDKTPVTAADRAAHEIITTGLEAAFPGTPVLSEEGDIPDFPARSTWRSYWLVDPLDGTREFVARNDEFTVNIAWIQDGYPVVGVVLAPVSGTLYCAQPGRGAMRSQSGGPLETIAVAEKLPTIPRVVGSRSHRGDELDDWLAARPEHAFVACGSSLKFCRIAEGSADVYPRFSATAVWDTAAGQAVAEAAGARVTTWQGERLSYAPRPSLINPNFVVGSATALNWAG